MASVLISNPHAAHFVYAHQPPQPPPSPPVDDMARCSLPSISNLLGLADQGSPTSETQPSLTAGAGNVGAGAGVVVTSAGASQATDRTAYRQPAAVDSRLTLDTSVAPPKFDSRPASSPYGRGALPPTPPMSSDASFDGHSSPSTRSVSQLSVVSQPQSTTTPTASSSSSSSSSSNNNYYYESTPPPLEADAHAHSHPYAHRHMAAPMVPRAPAPMPTAYATQHFSTAYLAPGASHLAAAPTAYYATGPVPSPVSARGPPPPAPMPALYYQRALPHQFPPGSAATTTATGGGGGGGGGGGANPWQHHHYISPSAAAAFPQSQDRYICQTCSKAFSRPSSLRIHSHSHTGEKPFKCPHAGCGKAFSVRSNMKRHERGCHNYESGSH